VAETSATTTGEDSFKIVETDTSELGYGGILKQKVLKSSHEQIVRFYPGVWNATQQNYSTIKKEIDSNKITTMGSKKI
jgi:hypothetical protein